MIVRYKLFYNQDIKDFLEEHFPYKVLNAFNKLKPFSYGQSSKYCIIYKNGGWYVDLGIKKLLRRMK